jgi:hypothetical protein
VFGIRTEMFTGRCCDKSGSVSVWKIGDFVSLFNRAASVFHAERPCVGLRAPSGR